MRKGKPQPGPRTTGFELRGLPGSAYEFGWRSSGSLPVWGVFIMGRIIAILASSCILAGCSSSMLPSIDFFKSSPSPESLPSRIRAAGRRSQDRCGPVLPDALRAEGPAGHRSVDHAGARWLSAAYRAADRRCRKTHSKPDLRRTEDGGTCRRQEEEDRGEKAQAQADDHGRSCDADRRRDRARADTARSCAGTGSGDEQFLSLVEPQITKIAPCRPAPRRPVF